MGFGSDLGLSLSLGWGLSLSLGLDLRVGVSVCGCGVGGGGGGGGGEWRWLGGGMLLSVAWSNPDISLQFVHLVRLYPCVGPCISVFLAFGKFKH